MLIRIVIGRWMFENGRMYRKTPHISMSKRVEWWMWDRVGWNTFVGRIHRWYIFRTFL
jgi:hypothetical protein